MAIAENVLGTLGSDVGMRRTWMSRSRPSLLIGGRLLKNIRRTLKKTILHNTWNEDQSESSASELHFDLNNEGGIQETEISHLVALPCSHFLPAYSLCGTCQKEQCQQCSLTCAACGKPIGRCHAVEVDKGAFLCTECHATQKRTSFFKLLASPIIRFSDTDDAT